MRFHDCYKDEVAFRNKNLLIVTFLFIHGTEQRVTKKGLTTKTRKMLLLLKTLVFSVQTFKMKMDSFKF